MRRLLKKGQLMWQELAPWLIGLGVLVLVLYFYYILKGKGEGALTFFRSLVKFR